MSTNMAITRSTPKKIKFDDSYNEGEFYTADEASQVVDEPSDSGLESDDAPEEELTATSKQAILDQQKREFERLQEQRRAERERRRQLDLQNKEQQEQKRLNKYADLPELLPTDVLEEVEKEQAKPKVHLKMNALEELEARRQLKLQKLKLLKDKRIVQKGPVSVAVQTFRKKPVVPRAEQAVVDVREQWLKRDSIRRK